LKTPDLQKQTKLAPKSDQADNSKAADDAAREVYCQDE